MPCNCGKPPEAAIQARAARHEHMKRLQEEAKKNLEAKLQKTQAEILTDHAAAVMELPEAPE
jgi:hypothetical protein